jgi:hypothetical protein
MLCLMNALFDQEPACTKRIGLYGRLHCVGCVWHESLGFVTDSNATCRYFQRQTQVEYLPAAADSIDTYCY